MSKEGVVWWEARRNLSYSISQMGRNWMAGIPHSIWTRPKCPGGIGETFKVEKNMTGFASRVESKLESRDEWMIDTRRCFWVYINSTGDI